VLVVAGKRVLLLAACVLSGAVAVPGEGAPSRIVDRTFRCTLAPLYGGVRELDVTANPRGSLGNGGSTSDVSPGYISLGSGPGTRAFDDFVFARSRLEERATGAPFPPGAYVNVQRCAPARVSVPLSAKSLPGPPVRFGTDADCKVPGRVFVRIRATLDTPTSWGQAARPYMGARRNVVEAKIAVRSERTRRPIGLIELDRAGVTRLWVASHCG
jgi:hypothetical protein